MNSADSTETAAPAMSLNKLGLRILVWFAFTIVALAFICALFAVSILCIAYNGGSLMWRIPLCCASVALGVVSYIGLRKFWNE